MIAALLLLFGMALTGVAAAEAGFGEKPDRPSLWQEFPVFELTEEERASLFSETDADPVTRMIDEDDDGRKQGWMAFTIDAPPPVVWSIVTNFARFHETDPAFPEAKGRRSFMPFVIYGNVCQEGGVTRLFQYFDPPSMAPRKFSAVYETDMAGFPWEARWLKDQNIACVGTPPEELVEEIAEAVPLSRNNGCWRIGPLPEAQRGNGSKTYAQYYLDSRLGGAAGRKKWLVNAAQKKALPRVCENIRFHAARWDDYIEKHFSPEEAQAFAALMDAYRKAMAP